MYFNILLGYGLCFSFSYGGMQKLAEEVQDSLKIQYPTQKKNEMLKIGKDADSVLPLTDESTGEKAQLDCIGDKKVIRYLGVPFEEGKISKMK
jgi:hypothetical protein